MSPVPIVRRAVSTADRVAAGDVVRAAFAVEEPLLAYRAGRLASARRSVAQAWLLEEDGVAKSSLLVYPLVFGTPEGALAPGYGLGAVSTHPEHRGRGFASLLCRRASEAAEAEGRAIGLLFSAIAPGFYERLGFRVAAAWKHVCARVSELAASGERARWTPLDPRSSTAELARLYAEAHRSSWHLVRDATAWERTLLVQPGDWWLGLGDPDGELTGYARVERDGEKALWVNELVLADPEVEPAALRGLARVAEELGLPALGGWLAPTPTVAAWFPDEGRAHTLPMLRGADPGAGPLRLSPADYF